MKKIGMFTACLLLVGTMAMAQDHQPNEDSPRRPARVTYSPETMAMMRVDRLMQSVELTPEEKEAVYVLFQKEEQEDLVRREAEQAERAKKIEAMKARRAQSEADLKKILGDEKYAQYEAAKNSDDKRNPQMRDPRQPKNSKKR